jgi:hypothetical protein
MRSVLLAILVASAGCHGSKASNPAWPAPSTTADDGGESLAPRQTSVAAAVEKSADDKNDDDEDKPAATDAKPAAASDIKEITPTPQTGTPDDEPIITDELIIEIEE